MVSATRVLLFVFLVTSWPAYATPPSIIRTAEARENRSMVYHGRIIKPNGNPVEGTTSVTLKIYSPDPALCLLWAETQTIQVTNGSFALEMGQPSNRASGATGGVASDFKQTFINNPSLNFTGATCASGTSYTPGVTDDRLLVATFTNDGTQVEVSGLPIKSVPFALQAEEIAGFGIGNLVKINGTSNVTFTPAEVQSLKDLLGGDINWDLKSRKLTKVVDPVAIDDAATKGYVDNAITASIVAAGAGTVTNVTVAGGGLSVANGSTTPTITLAQANTTTAGYLSSADWNTFNNKQPAGAYLTSITSGNVTTALGFTPVSNALPTGQVFIGDGSNVATGGFFGIGQMRNNIGTLQMPTSCTAAQTLTWSAVTDVLACTNISIASGAVSGLGALATKSSVDLSTADATGTLAAARFPALTGDVTTTAGSLATSIAANAVVTAKINDKAVTLAKVQDIATNSLLGRSTAATGVPEVITVGSGLSLSAGTLTATNTNAGTVTNVASAGAPLSVTNGTTTPTISIAQANTTTAGYLSSTDWNTFNTKQAAITPTGGDANKVFGANAAGNGNEFKAITGAGSVTVSHTAGGITITGAAGGGGTVTNVDVGGLPLSVTNGTSTPTISIAQANTTTAGYLSSTDWNTFNSKQTAGTYLTALTGEVTANGPGSAAATIAANAVTTVKIADANVTTAKINDKAVTLAKVQDIATNSLLGRSTAATGVPEVITVGSGLSLSGGTLTATNTNAGTVTSVGVSVPAYMSSSGGPITSSGSITLGYNNQAQNSVFAGPATGGAGAVSFRALDPADIPALNTSKLTAGTLALARGGTGVSPAGVIGDANKVFGLDAAGTAGEMKSIVQGSGVTITQGAGTITIAATGSGGTVTNVGVGGLPLSVTNGSSTPTVSIAQANTTTAGYLSSADWNTFNNKQAAGSYQTTTLADGKVWIGNGSNVAAEQWFGVDDLKTSTGLQQFAASCTAAQTLTWSAITDAFSCTNIAIGSSNITDNSVANADLRQGAARSVIGVTGNTTANVADIAGTTDQVLRVDSAGTGLSFGAINLAASAAVSGTLPVANGGTGTATGSITATAGNGLTFTAGSGGNYNVRLTPSGTGYTILDGSVGIGTTSPASRFDVSASADGEIARLRRTGATNNNGLFISATEASDNVIINAAGSGSTAGGLKLQVSAADVMTLKGTKVGIGTTSPVARFHVANDATAMEGLFGDDISGGTLNDASTRVLVGNTATNSFLRLGQSTTAFGSLGWVYNATEASAYLNVTTANSSQSLALQTGGGNVGIGTTSPGEKLEVSGNAKATAFISTSDRRLKENIRTVTGLDNILRLRGVSYDWKKDGVHDMGLIAQEVEKVFPELVVTDKKSGYKAVKYNGLIAPLIEATKELSLRCEMDREQLDRLREENARLKEAVKSLDERLRALEAKFAH